jgi:hypothetical protein
LIFPAIIPAAETEARLDDIAEWVAQHSAVQPKVGEKFATGDTEDDLVSVDPDTGKLWLYPGRRNGTLAARLQFSTANWAGMTQWAAGNFTADARDELVAIEGSTGKLWLYSSSPAGIGAAPVLIGSSGWSSMDSLATGDFNHDNHTDLVALEPAPLPTLKHLWLYLGTGTRAPPFRSTDLGDC